MTRRKAWKPSSATHKRCKWRLGLVNAAPVVSGARLEAGGRGWDAVSGGGGCCPRQQRRGRMRRTGSGPCQLAERYGRDNAPDCRGLGPNRVRAVSLHRALGGGCIASPWLPCNTPLQLGETFPCAHSRRIVLPLQAASPVRVPSQAGHCRSSNQLPFGLGGSSQSICPSCRPGPRSIHVIATSQLHPASGGSLPSWLGFVPVAAQLQHCGPGGTHPARKWRTQSRAGCCRSSMRRAPSLTPATLPRAWGSTTWLWWA